MMMWDDQACKGPTAEFLGRVFLHHRQHSLRALTLLLVNRG